MAWGLPDKRTLHAQRLLTEATLYSHIPSNSQAAEQPKEKKHQTYFEQAFRHKFQGIYVPSFCFPPIARTGIQTTKKAAVTAIAQRCRANCCALGPLHSRLKIARIAHLQRFANRIASTAARQKHPQERRIHRLYNGPGALENTAFSEPAHAKSATCGATAPHKPLVAQPLNPAELAKTHAFACNSCRATGETVAAHWGPSLRLNQIHLQPPRVRRQGRRATGTNQTQLAGILPHSDPSNPGTGISSPSYNQ